MNTTLIWRFVRSGFGIRKLARRASLAKIRHEIVTRIKGGGKPMTRRETSALLGMPVLLADPEIEAIQRYAGKANAVIAEIGCAYGGSSLLWSLGKKNGVKLHSIDPFVTDSMDAFRATRDLCYGHVTQALQDVGKADRIADWNLIPDYSYNVVKTWDTPIDVLFIDGDHTYPAVKQDYDQWLSKVRQGGHILFHDSCIVPGTPEGKYSKGWPGPSRFTDELIAQDPALLVERVHSITVLRKK